MKYPNAAAVPRNDFEAARQFYEASKPLRPDEYHMLVLSQDDPDAFIERTSDWEVREPGSILDEMLDG